VSVVNVMRDRQPGGALERNSYEEHQYVATNNENEQVASFHSLPIRIIAYAIAADVSSGLPNVKR
jgi:hypothetical protein